MATLMPCHALVQKSLSVMNIDPGWPQMTYHVEGANTVKSDMMTGLTLLPQ